MAPVSSVIIDPRASETMAPHGCQAVALPDFCLEKPHIQNSLE